MTLTLKAIAEAVDANGPTYFVLQRANGHWSTAAKIISISANEKIAEAIAAKEKRAHPHQSYGVAVLRSEAREVPNPIEIVRMEKS